MHTTNSDVAKQLAETRIKLAYMARYLTWAAMVGVALNDIKAQQSAAVTGVAGTTATLTNKNGGYKLTWRRNGNRLTLNHHGRWKSESMDASGESHHTMSRGRVMPLHDDGWVKRLKGDHGLGCSRKAVRFFAKLLATPEPSIGATA